MDDKDNTPQTTLNNTDNNKIQDIVQPQTAPVLGSSEVVEPVPAAESTPDRTPPAASVPASVITPVETNTSEQSEIVVPPAPKKKRGKTLALLLLILVLLAGAGGAYWWYSHRNSKDTATATATVAKKDIAHIRYVSANYGWESFYPGIDDSSTYVDSNIMIFEGLVRFDNKTQIVPLLATGWTNPDASTWVFNLRKDVTFHDGRVMTPEDVKLSFEAAKDTSLGEVYASTMKSIEVTGANQVTIKTDGPDPTLLRKLTGYFVFDTKSGKTNDPINGTGPFTVKPGTTPSTKSLELVAYDKYWDGRPHVRSFSFTGIDDYDNEKAYGDGKADMMSTFADKPTATGSRKYSQLALDQSSVFLMPLNTLKAGTPLANVKVRQAIQLALDPMAIAKVRSTDAIPATQIVPSSIPGYDPSVKRPDRDITKAKELLKEAGYPNGITFGLTYFAPSQPTGVEIQKELAEAGIKVTLDPQTDSKNIVAKISNGTVDSVFSTYTSDYFDGSDVLSNYDDTPIYKSQTVVDLVTKANSTLDTSSRLTYLKQASHAMATDLGVEPIYVESGDSIIFDPSFVITRDVANNSIGVYFQKVYAK